ncbi:GcrA family cell cycle regulator [Amorphus orientalis]|uniref:GcrA cell cycle regulator n=1 Tax=Amorphus orientalis TaxID=649198 RepID=A0AAE4ATY9_9HYPH|nr:GcrA family cell cycle regulator [Amorphus orientalis]MDQ0316783.1 GcrA cell cycle regulator [Amorphus orientalis]
MSEEPTASWTDERVELLQKLWSEGLSASQIATQLGGVTRNAVIGKIHRLGLSGRAKTPSQQRPRKQRPAPKPAGRVAASASSSGAGATQTVARASRVVGNAALKIATDPEPETAPAVAARGQAEIVPFGDRKTLLELNEHTCRWPMGDPGSQDFAFCGRESTPGEPYCAAHARVAYQPAPDRRKSRNGGK